MFPHSSQVVSFSEALRLGDTGSPLSNGSRQHKGTARLLVVAKRNSLGFVVLFLLGFFVFSIFFCLVFWGFFCFLKEKYSEDTRKKIKQRKRKETLGEEALPGTSNTSWCVTNKISLFFDTPATPQNYIVQLLPFPLQEALTGCAKSLTLDYVLSTHPPPPPSHCQESIH